MENYSGMNMYQLSELASGDEILRNLKPFDDKSPTFSAFYTEFIDSVRTRFPRDMAVVFAGGFGASGKTDSLNQMTINAICELTNLCSDELPNSAWILDSPEQNLIHYRMPWISAVREAVKLRLVPKRNLGDWWQNDTDIMTSLGARTIDLGMNGIQDVMGLATLPRIKNPFSSFWGIDAPVLTATGAKEKTGRKSDGYNYHGFNRFFTLLKRLCDQRPEKTFVYFVLTDAESEYRRLMARSLINSTTSLPTLRNWFEKVMNTETGEFNEKEFKKLHDYATSSADVHAAAICSHQNASLILKLHKLEEIGLTREEQEVISEEVKLFEGGYSLLSQEIQGIRDDVIAITGEKFLPHFFQSLGIPKSRWFRFWNSDIEERLHIPLTLPKDFGLIEKIDQINPRLLLAN